MKKIISICAVAIVMFFGMGSVSQLMAQDDSTEEPTLTITEYSDYQCPACAYFHPMVKKLEKEYGDQIELNLKFFPLNNHQFAALAARAAQSAKNQGKFREMHNLIFQNQKRWSQSSNPAPIFESYAKKIGLDMEAFRNDINSSETQKAVMKEKQEGVNKGVNSTPTFFIDGQKIDPLPRTYSQFEQIVQQFLDKKAKG